MLLKGSLEVVMLLAVALEICIRGSGESLLLRLGLVAKSLDVLMWCVVTLSVSV